MQSIVIITPPNITLEYFMKKLDLYYDIEIVSSDRIVINDTGRYVAMNLDCCITEEYDEKELDIVSHIIAEPKFFLVEFSHLDLLKEIIPCCLDNYGFLIDSNHGDILSEQEFLSKLKKNPMWDWRMTYSP